mgnify:CR=1 FL=1
MELYRDISMSFPEDIWSLDVVSRYFRTHVFSEAAILDERRYFLRAALFVPIEDGSDFVWGVWCEVSQKDHDRYLKAYVEEKTGEMAPISGQLANELPCYEGSLNLRVKLIPNPFGRPKVQIIGDSTLKDDQLKGISLKKLEELNSVLFGDDEEEAESIEP